MNAQVLLIDRPHDGCALLTLNRPEVLNALSADLRSALADGVRTLSADDSVRVVVLAGQGRAFCAGLDLKELSESGVPATGGIDDPVRALNDCPKPVIGVIHGAAITGGFELALACDVLLASPEARFADTHARIGVLPGWGLSQRLARIVGRSRARELAFTGRFIDGATAEPWGLVSRVVPLAELRPQALALAEEMASVDPTTLRAYKSLLNDGEALSLGEALELESQRSRAWAATQSTSELGQRGQILQARRRMRDR
jgi:enoyl-CoA hydratase